MKLFDAVTDYVESESKLTDPDLFMQFKFMIMQYGDWLLTFYCAYDKAVTRDNGIFATDYEGPWNLLEEGNIELDTEKHLKIGFGSTYEKAYNNLEIVIALPTNIIIEHKC